MTHQALDALITITITITGHQLHGQRPSLPGGEQVLRTVTRSS